MRIPSLPLLAIAISATVCQPAHASSDGSCYPTWSLTRSSLDACSNVPFLSPGNDSRVNLRLLLADRKVLELAPNALGEDEISEGYGPVPFDIARLAGTTIEEEQATDASTVQLNALLQKLGIERDHMETAGDAFLEGEGSRCRSNSDDSAAAFVGQVVDTPQLSASERQALARARMQLLDACTWDPQQLASLLPGAGDLPSPQGKAFVAYLQASAAFYSGRYSEALAGFTELASDPQPWLKEVSLYMLARVRLNDAQQDAFDEYGSLKGNIDPGPYTKVEQALDDYLKAYPNGRYAASAKGLMRRAHWLAGNKNKLADDYAWQLTDAREEQRSVPVNALVQEIDNKLLASAGDSLAIPLLTAVHDLMVMRPEGEVKLTPERLLAQKSLLAQQPGLFEYLQAALAFYVDKSPAQALTLLPKEVPAALDYLAFSEQTLRGLALEASNDLPAAQALWLELLPLARQPLQREQVELALALNYERSGQVAKVFAADSPIKSAQLRLILLGKVADAPLLRQQAEQGIDGKEKATARFVLLYKDLLYGQYAEFADDLKALPEQPADERLTSSLGYAYGDGQTLRLFRWNGDKAESGYTCPSIVETASTLQARRQDPKGLNCLGEFILRNGLDGMPLDQRPNADQLGASEPAFQGAAYSRLEGYQAVIADGKAERDDKAYALYRAINCYAPSGYNGCGGKDVASAVRKAWFKQLKTTYGATRWGKALQYYW
ncbi:outer membrane assembly lipoprotein YfiO [Pseudomonas sp. RIT-PI-S]|uniref:outer membrane assembly lipoprotein YfiO n=1 Tax=Pseudomonas sp. RIT-PI-S TaxID=3035295 RepID=UPI0021D8686F|nr:outer membrane assembly lipoprotein YfiO [Pseudomonas sp. RIT-PI-S]